VQAPRAGVPWWLVGALALLLLAALGLLLAELAGEPEIVEVTRLVAEPVEVTRIVPEVVREVTRVVTEIVEMEDQVREVTRIVTESVEVTRVVTATPTP
jgi:hypothetical protein